MQSVALLQEDDLDEDAEEGPGGQDGQEPPSLLTTEKAKALGAGMTWTSEGFVRRHLGQKLLFLC